MNTYYYDIFIYVIVALFILLAIMILISLYLAIKDQKKLESFLKNSHNRNHPNNDVIGYYKNLYKTTLQELNTLKKVNSTNQDEQGKSVVQPQQKLCGFNNLEEELEYYKQGYSRAIQDIKIQTEQNSELRILVHELKEEINSLYDKMEGGNHVTSDLAPDSCEKIFQGRHHQ
ncbi:putative membrane protein [Ehrlichia ruminantium]|uniref:Putative membrane protein n=1 Tax=Ehrlichia ruminantium TaxID=779 RepID=A0A170SVL5_EHRRU|nr:hypothetical protein [Ehrlichia ruminantium]GAT78394.1 putative membrane protein [Ehrlichia ruminantium]